MVTPRSNDSLHSHLDCVGDASSSAHVATNSEGPERKGAELFGPWMVAEKRRRQPSLRTTNVVTPKPMTVGVGNGVVKNAAYMASNPDKRSKAAPKPSQAAIVIPMVAGQSAKVVDMLWQLEQDSMFHSSDEENMYDMYDRDEMTDAEEVERPLANKVSAIGPLVHQLLPSIDSNVSCVPVVSMADFIGD
ncbi:hypothetical protein V6N13_130597 [Hibiscus sabdariffa]